MASVELATGGDVAAEVVRERQAQQGPGNLRLCPLAELPGELQPRGVGDDGARLSYPLPTATEAVGGAPSSTALILSTPAARIYSSVL
jgi:hypothetical protein